MLLGLRTAIYPVADLTQAKIWYAQILGIQPYFDQPFFVGFSVGGFELGLLPNGTPSPHGSQALWGVENAEVAFSKLLAHGATALEAITDVGEGIKVAAVLDPFGNRLSIIENPHFNPAAVR